MTREGPKPTWPWVLCAAACAAAAAACSAQATVSQVQPQVSDAGPSGGQSGQSGTGSGGSIISMVPEVGRPPVVPPDAGQVGVPQDIETMRIDPADSVLVVDCAQSGTVSFRAFATMQAGGGEVEITDRTVFYVPDNYLVGTFPLDGSSTFTTRLPASATDPPQRGGALTIQAQAASTDIPITTVTTTLTVKIVCSGQAATGSPGATPALPAIRGPSSRVATVQPWLPRWSIRMTACCFLPTFNSLKFTSCREARPANSMRSRS